MNTREEIDQYIAQFPDWRGERLQQLRALIHTADPRLVEGFKWGVPVWTSDGLVCAISAFKDHVKMNFFKGAHLADPQGMFNSGLDSKEHRSINFAEHDVINSDAIGALITEAITLNQS